MTTEPYWTWWMGGMVLGTVVLAHLWFTGRLLAVSGILPRILRWRADEQDRASELEIEKGGFDESLMAATLAQFGPEAVAELNADLPMDVPDNVSQFGDVRVPISAAFLFVLFLVLGGTLSAWITVGFALDWSLGSQYEEPVVSPGLRLALPAVGGLLVGFGARMAGGCTSSHGLVGCARLQGGSLLSTAGFFVGGIAVSYTIGMSG